MMLHSNWTANANLGANQHPAAQANTASEGATGVHAALSDIEPPANHSRRVFGQPGTIR